MESWCEQRGTVSHSNPLRLPHPVIRSKSEAIYSVLPPKKSCLQSGPILLDSNYRTQQYPSVRFEAISFLNYWSELYFQPGLHK